MHFLDAEKDWLLPSMFGGKSVGKVAHGLAGMHIMVYILTTPSPIKTGLTGPCCKTALN